MAPDPRGVLFITLGETRVSSVTLTCLVFIAQGVLLNIAEWGWSETGGWPDLSNLADMAAVQEWSGADTDAPPGINTFGALEGRRETTAEKTHKHIVEKSRSGGYVPPSGRGIP